MNLHDDIMKVMTTYTQEIAEQVEEAAGRIAAQAQQQLKETSPRSTEKRRKAVKVKHYADCWSTQKFKGSRAFRYVIYQNSEKWRIIHLLENGFIHKPDKGKVEGQPHVQPAQEWANREFEKACEKIINNA